MNEHETTADIIADKRFDATTRDQFDSAYIVDFCDRLEAAHKRETVTGSNQLREALKLCVAAMCQYCVADAEARGLPMECVNGCEVLLMAKDALAAPPRNCDRFATLDEARAAHEAICEKYVKCHNGCPLNNEEHYSAFDCFEAWLFATATEKEGGDDENE